MIDINNLWQYNLRKGSSSHPQNGACLFDAASWLVYGKIGDNPPCSCPVIRTYGIGLNDKMSNKTRQLLKPFILRVVGNRDPQSEPARLRCIVLETARKIVPLAVDRAKLYEQSAILRSLPNDASYEEIGATANAAASAARSAAHAAAHAAARAADAADAARAADAADAAHAASSAAYAAYAASSAAHAANAAAYAASSAASASATSASADAWKISITILDQALRIGKQSPEFDEQQVVESIKRFEIAARHVERV